MEQCETLLKIEKLRNELNQLVDDLNITSQLVIQKSQELDRFLNEYNKKYF